VTLTWIPCDPDAVLNVVFVAVITLTGWNPCPTPEIPEQMCPAYQFSGWADVARTPDNSVVYDLPTPGVGGITLATIEGEDASGNLSPPTDSEGDCP
jgi:hypothetical protein